MVDAEKQDLRVRTRRYALRIIRLYASLPRTGVGGVLGYQILKAGTSVGAHWREAHRSRSVAEFVSKMEGGLQELDETDYWLELLVESGIVKAPLLADLQEETQELIAIFTSSVLTAKKRKRK